MPTTLPLQVKSSLGGHVAAEIRAQMARLNVTNRQIGRVIGQGDSATSRRLSGRYPLTLDEVEAISSYLGVSMLELVRSYSPPVRPDDDPASAEVLPRLDSNQKPFGNWPRLRAVRRAA